MKMTGTVEPEALSRRCSSIPEIPPSQTSTSMQSGRTEAPRSSQSSADENTLVSKPRAPSRSLSDTCMRGSSSTIAMILCGLATDVRIPASLAHAARGPSPWYCCHVYDMRSRGAIASRDSNRPAGGSIDRRNRRSSPPSRAASHAPEHRAEGKFGNNSRVVRRLFLASGFGQEPEPMRGHRKVGNRVHAELLQHIMPVEFDRPFRDAEGIGDLLVRFAPREQREDVVLARGELCHDRSQGCVPAVALARFFAVHERAFDGLEQTRLGDRLGQDVFRAGLDGAHRGGNVAMSGHEDDRRCSSLGGEPILQLRPAASRHPHVEQDARGLVAERLLQKVRRRFVKLDAIVAGTQQVADCRQKRRIVINDMNERRLRSRLALNRSRRTRHCRPPAALSPTASRRLENQFAVVGNAAKPAHAPVSVAILVPNDLGWNSSNGLMDYP